MNQPYYPDLVFTLSELLDNGVVQHAEFISELSAASSGEAQLQESVESISKVRPYESAHRRDQAIQLISTSRQEYVVKALWSLLQRGCGNDWLLTDCDGLQVGFGAFMNQESMSYVNTDET